MLLWIIATILVFLWLAGLVAHVAGGLINILLVIAVILVIVALVKRWQGKLRLETAKKEGLQWIAQGNAPIPTQYARLRDVLTKARNDKEASDILKKLSQLRPVVR